MAHSFDQRSFGVGIKVVDRPSLGARKATASGLARRTYSVEHLRENLHAAKIQLPPGMIADLDSIGGSPGQ